VTAEVVLATRNPHKIEELQRILAGSDLRILGLDAFPEAPDVPETGVTFAENALLKATAIAISTGLPAVADDSGLCVDVLGGAPGVFSARWSGRHGDDVANLSLLIAQLVDVPAGHRRAHFACAAALVVPAPFGGATAAAQDDSAVASQVVTEGRLDGVLAHAPRGTNGFGYDPIFVPDGDDRTTAQMAAAEKDAISHRGKAFREMTPHLIALTSRG
jgi:XTP/dITP diphosphohydrolase